MLPLPSSGQCHYTVAFSPDGRWLVAGGSDSAADVWNLHEPQNPARRLPGGAEPIVRVQFGPNGQLMVVSVSQVRFIDAAAPAGRIPNGINVDRVSRAAVSPEADLVVLVSNDGLSAWAPRPLAAPDWVRGERPQGNIADIALTTTRRLIVVGSDLTAPSGEIEIRNLGTGLVMDTIRVTGRPHRVACSADGTLAAILAHGHLSVWNLTTRTRVVDRTVSAHGGWLSVAFDPRGRRIVTGGIDSTVAVWDATSDGPPLHTFQWGVGPVYAVAFDRDGLRAAAAGHSGAIVWDVDE
jgi:WD40 repeat protein